MGFNFGFPAVDNGQLDPSTQAMIASMASPPAADPQASAPQPAPQPQQQQASPQGLPDIKVSPLEAVASWLAHGGTPAEAAQAARAVKVRNIVDSYNLQLAQMRAQGLQSAGDDERKAVLYGDTPAGKAYADRIATHALSGGQTLVNGGPGGQPFTATTYGVDHSTPYALGPRVPGGFQSGPQMPGDTQVDAASGGLYNNQGPTSAAFGRPQVVAPGSTLQNYQTSVRGQPGQGGPAPQGQGGTLDPLAFFKGFVLPHEGGLNPHDMNGAPTKYGINQAANPGVNVSTLKPDDAAQIFAQKYFAQSGAANMPAPLAAVHADTYFINPKMANTFLKQSGGDPNTYLGLRDAWMSRLVQSNPKAVPYAKAWAQRNADLAQFINGRGQGQGQGQGPQSGIPAQVTPLAQGNTTQILPPGHPAYNGVARGTRLQRDAQGNVTTYAKPSEADQKTVEGYRDTAKTAEDMSALGDRFLNLNKRTATGMGYEPFEVPIPFSHGSHVNLNVPGAIGERVHHDVPEMENLTTQMALAQRSPGMRVTQMEFQKFLGTQPGIENFPGQNTEIVQGYHQLAGQRRAYANFMSDYLAKNGSLAGADDAWKSAQKPGGGSSTPRIRTYNPKTGNLE